MTHLGLRAMGAALVMVGAGTLGVEAQTSANDDDDPLALFAELMPVFRSPRCVNCHGGTDPNPKPDGRNHGGGQIDVAMDSIGNMNFDAKGVCLECHTAPAANPQWRLAPVPMSFVGKDALPMCRQMRFFNTLALVPKRAEFIGHLHNDPLIGLAFEGQSGIDANSPMDPVTSAPPPMSKTEFLAAAQRWVDGGQALCSNKWSGTITETTTALESVTFAPAPGGREVGGETHISITVVENKATATVQWAMHDFTDVPTRECAAFVHESFFANGTKLPVDFTIGLNPPTVPIGEFTMPDLPTGMTLPPGFTLPPEMSLPPGMTLPPGMEIPTVTPGGAFFQYTAPLESDVSGTHRSEIQSLPGCKLDKKDERHAYHMVGAQVQVVVDPNDPNHLVGEKVIPGQTGKTVITWNLTRGEGEGESFLP